MELQTTECNEVEVQFISDQEVVHIINDEIQQKNHSKILNNTSKCLKDTPNRSRASTRNKNKSYQTFDDNNCYKEYNENESDVILKPKVLFDDGDVPGDRMFGFNLKERKPTTSKISPLKTPNSKTKTITKYEIIQSNKSQQYDKKRSNIHSQDLFDDESENESRMTNKKLTRSSSKLAILKAKNESLNESQNSNGTKFSYKTPKKSKKNENSIELKCNLTPKTPRSEKYVGTMQILTKTPKIVRKNIAKGIAHQKLEELGEFSDSDYSISDNSESESDSSTHSNVKTVQSDINVNNTNTILRKSTRKKDIPFMYKSEEYFLSKSAKSMKKSKTSDNTLKLLKNPVLDKTQVDKLSEHYNTVHDKKLKALYKEILSNFPYWFYLLKEGFNLILYGYGSKRQIIKDFKTSMLEQESVLIINGFFPGLTLKEILESITIDLLGLDSCPANAELAVQLIEETQKLKNAEHIYILIHNLDGVELQSYKMQHILSRICSLKNVHLIASIDRVNAALMWDNTKLGDYNFLWMDCTNYLPYTVETSYIESLMVKNSGSIHAFSALNNVFKSLNSNSKSILLLLIKNRIENKNDKKYGGVPFSVLYGWCRQRFLASTDLALRSQLTEFVDHQLVKWKRDSDVLFVPVDVDVLIQFFKQNEEDDE